MRRRSRIDRVSEALQEAAAYTDRLVHDRRLRSDLRSAIENGSVATKLVRRDVGRSRSASRLAADARLRKSLRAFVDDISSAAGHAQRKKKSHRVRNVLLVVGGTGAAVAAATKGRRWLSSQMNGQGAAAPVAP